MSTITCMFGWAISQTHDLFFCSISSGTLSCRNSLQLDQICCLCCRWVCQKLSSSCFESVVHKIYGALLCCCDACYVWNVWIDSPQIFNEWLLSNTGLRTLFPFAAKCLYSHTVCYNWLNGESPSCIIHFKLHRWVSKGNALKASTGLYHWTSSAKWTREWTLYTMKDAPCNALACSSPQQSDSKRKNNVQNLPLIE